MSSDRTISVYHMYVVHHVDTTAYDSVQDSSSHGAISSRFGLSTAHEIHSLAGARLATNPHRCVVRVASSKGLFSVLSFLKISRRLISSHLLSNRPDFQKLVRVTQAFG